MVNVPVNTPKIAEREKGEKVSYKKQSCDCYSPEIVIEEENSPPEIHKHALIITMILLTMILLTMTL